MDKKTNIRYKIAKIQLTEFSGNTEAIKPDSDISVETGFQFAYDKEQRLIACKADVEYHQSSETIMKASMVCCLEIHQDSVSDLTSDQKIEFPVYFLVQLASITYGSMRGAISLKAEGTALDSCILPPLYVQEVVKGSLVIQL